MVMIMQYRTVPKNGDKLSVLGFGCMRLPERNGRIDPKAAAEQIHHAIDNGVNFIDTAMPYHYGASEPFIGKILEGEYRESVKLCTKLPPWSVKKRDDMDDLLNSQLMRLRTDHLDYYLVHNLNNDNWSRMMDLDILDFLDSIKQDGRATNVGFSFHGDIKLFKQIVDAYDWTACLVMYNYMDTQNQAGSEGVRYASDRDIAVFVMEPLRGGNLAGRVPDKVRAIWDSAEVKRSPAEWAFRWVWDHPEVTMLLSGMNRMEHVKENIRIANDVLPNSLSQGERDLISRAREQYFSLTKIGCTGCGYCMPCKFGVNIPACFETYNSKYLFGDGRARMNYALRVGGMMSGRATASMCTNCGKCMTHCPQHLQIPDLLKDVRDEFEGRTFGPFVWSASRYLALTRWRNIRRARRSAENFMRGDAQ